MNYLKLIVIALTLLWAFPAQAQVDCGAKTSCIGLFFTVPSGTTESISPELDVVDVGTTLTRYERVIEWACGAHPLFDVDGNPLGCGTPALKAQHVQARLTADWIGFRNNVLAWEKQERKAAVEPGPDLPAE